MFLKTEKLRLRVLLTTEVPVLHAKQLFLLTGTIQIKPIQVSLNISRMMSFWSGLVTTLLIFAWLV